MAVADDLSTSELLEAAHAARSSLEMLVVTLDRLLLCLPSDMLRFRHDSLQRGWIGRRLVRRNTLRAHVGSRDGLREEGRGRRRIVRLAQVDVDHLAVLVDGPVSVDPVAGQPDVGLVHSPTATNAMAMRTRRVLIQRREALHPIEHTRRIDVDATLGQKLHNIGIYVDTLR